MAILAREIRERCKGRVDEQVMYCMEAMAEHLGVLKQQITELAMMLDQQTNILTDLTVVAGNMKSVVDRVKHLEHDDDGPPVTE